MTKEPEDRVRGYVARVVALLNDAGLMECPSMFRRADVVPTVLHAVRGRPGYADAPGFDAVRDACADAMTAFAWAPRDAVRAARLRAAQGDAEIFAEVRVVRTGSLMQLRAASLLTLACRSFDPQLREVLASRTAHFLIDALLDRTKPGAYDTARTESHQLFAECLAVCEAPYGAQDWVVMGQFVTDTVYELTRQMRATNDYSAAPVLADALEDAGFSNRSALNHLRAPGTPWYRTAGIFQKILATRAP